MSGIIIRKYEGGEAFDLPSNYVIEGERNNPLFENKGSQTVPIAFPTTIKNNRLLKFPFRLDKTEKQEETTEVIVETGSLQQRGLLSVNSASEKIISANIGYDESIMYAQFSKMKLRNIPNLPVISFPGNNVSQRVDSCLSHLTVVMKQQIEADYYIFPVVLQVEKTETNWYYEILNEVDTKIVDINNLPNGRIAELKGLTERVVTRYEGGEEIEYHVMKGYGVSPFLKVYRILEFIFENYGLSIIENPFKEHRQLKKLVVLNNAFDSVVTGIINYKDLMPDITIQEFLDALYAKFGMLYFIDSGSKTTMIKLLKNIVPDKNYNASDLTKSKNSEPSISFSSQKQLRLKMNREIESAGVLYDTFEEFLEKFNNEFTDTPVIWPGTGTNQLGVLSQIFRQSDSRYHIINIFNTLESNQFSSSDFFDWDKKTPDMEYEDIEMKDLCVPLDSSIYIGGYNYLHYLIKYKHLYSDIVIGGEMQENIENPAKLAFAFGWGLTNKSGAADFNYFFASQFNRDINGNFIYENNQKYDISLTCNRIDGLYNRFWKEYDSFIRHSNQEISCNLHLSDIEAQTLKMDKQVLINNQLLIPKQIKYKLNKTGNISECTFRTLRLYEPYDLEMEQAIPVYRKQKYFWAFTSTDSSTPPSVYVSLRVIEDKYYTVSGISVPKTNISFLPPTEVQFESQETRIYKYVTIYKLTIGFSIITTTVTYRPAKIIY